MDIKTKKQLNINILVALIVLIAIPLIINFIFPIVLAVGANFFNLIYQQAALGYSFWWQIIVFLAILASLTRITLRDLVGNKEAKCRKIRMTIFLILIVLCFVIFFIYFVSNKLNASFQQRFNIIAPHIPEEEAKNLKAMWSTMSSRADYRAICNKIHIYAQRNNIKLPR